MERTLTLAPSILSADFSRLAAEVAEIADVVELLHVDVMDGHYVPNITFGPPVVESLRGATDLPFDTHLMIERPREWVERFVKAGSTSCTFHLHTSDGADDELGIVRDLHAMGAEAGVGIKPAEDPEEARHLFEEVDLVVVMTVEPGFGGQPFREDVLWKVEQLDRLRVTEGYHWRLEVDGGVSRKTVRSCTAAGADVFVAGSAVFGADDRRAAVAEIMAAAADADSDQDHTA